MIIVKIPCQKISLKSLNKVLCERKEFGFVPLPDSPPVSSPEYNELSGKFETPVKPKTKNPEPKSNTGIFSLKRKPEEPALLQIASPMKKPRVEPMKTPEAPKPTPLPILEPLRMPNMPPPPGQNKYLRPISTFVQRVPIEPPIPRHSKAQSPPPVVPPAKKSSHAPLPPCPEYETISPVAVFSPDADISSPNSNDKVKAKKVVNYDDLLKNQADPRLSRSEEYPKRKFRKIFLRPSFSFWCQARSSVAFNIRDKRWLNYNSFHTITNLSQVTSFFKEDSIYNSDFKNEIHQLKRLLNILVKGVKPRNQFGASNRILEHYKSILEAIPRELDHLLNLLRYINLKIKGNYLNLKFSRDVENEVDRYAGKFVKSRLQTDTWRFSFSGINAITKFLTHYVEICQTLEQLRGPIGMRFSPDLSCDIGRVIIF